MKLQGTRLRVMVFLFSGAGGDASPEGPGYLFSSLLICLIAAATVAGCGSGSGVKAGAISISNAAGATLTSLTTSAKADVSMTPVNDKQGAGVDWSVFCEGSPITGSTSGGACGTLSPAHTSAGTASVYTAPTTVPIGGTVTITAAVTSDPSATSSATLKIEASPIAISFATTPPTVLSVNAVTSFGVQIANDVTGAGATWTTSCGSTASGACGSLGTPSTALSGTTSTTEVMYTAPGAVPPAAVTLTATSAADSTKSISATFTIQGPPPPITISLSPNAIALGESRTGIPETANLIATLTNDTSNAGVTWTVSCTSLSGACGSFIPGSGQTASGTAITYKAPTSLPTGGTVTITAAATADLSVTASAAATITSTSSISVTVTVPSPAMSALQATTISASVTGDSSQEGVDWSLSCGSSAPGACGAVSPAFTPVSATGSYAVSTMYTAPAAIPPEGVVIVSATPNVLSGSNPPAGNPGLATITIATPPSISFPQQPPATITAGAQAAVSAVVANDVAPGGVTWTTQCSSTVAGGCGWVEPYQTASGNVAMYTAPPVPPGGPVTLVATSVSFPDVSASTAPMNINAATAISVNFVPVPPTQVQEGASVNLNAAAANDSTNAGIDWQVCASGCGFFTVVPEIPPPLQSPNQPPTLAVTATSVKGWPNGRPILYTAPATSGVVTITTVATATDRATNPVSNAASVSITAQGTGPNLQGMVLAGTQPLIGAHVGLFAASNAGYGSASTLISVPGASPYSTTNASGVFSIPAGYGCPSAASEMYLVATGGHVGSNPANPNLAMMALLGPCGPLSSSPVTVDEVTTVASAFALAPFAANPLTTGQTTYLNIGAGSGDAAGLQNAFAAANNLVNLSTGQALFTVPAGNAAVPFAELNTLADILNACTATSGGTAGDGSPCGSLFVAANPYRNVTGTIYSGVPADTLQAAFEIAQNPDFSGTGVSNVDAVIDGSSLFAAVTPASPFQPVLSTAPFDFSVSLNFTGGGGVSGSSGNNFLALDSSGDLWFTNAAGNSVSEWTNQGAAISPASGYVTPTLADPGPLAIDTTGNAWVCGENGVTELNFVGSELPNSPFGGGGLISSGCQNLAIDGIGNIWTVNNASVTKLNDLGQALSPASGYTIPVSPTDSLAVSLALPLAIDDSNNVWVGANAPVYPINLSLAELNNGGGLPNFLTPNSFGTVPPSNFVNTNGFPGQVQIAIDHSGNVWMPATQTDCFPGTLARVPAYQGIGTTDQASTAFNYSGGTDPFRCSGGIAVDGAGVIWTASVGGPSQGAGGAPLTPPNVGAYNPSLAADVFGYASASLAAGPESVAVDGSGNVWVLLSNNTITEFVGLATPAVTPQSAAVKSRKLGAKP